MRVEEPANFAGLVIDDCTTCRGPILRPQYAHYCPRCGGDVRQRPREDPMIIRTPTHAIIVHGSLGGGDAARLYECQAVSPAIVTRATRHDGATHVFKIAATPAANDAMKNEASTLHLLTFACDFHHYQAFVPRVIESFLYVDQSRAERRVNVLAYDKSIRSPRELFSLIELRAAYPEGLDARDAAWIFRRLLALLAAAHEAGIAHNAVTPAHVLVEPRDHKLMLVGWSHASGVEAVPHVAKAEALARAWMSGFDASPLSGRGADVALAARTMTYLLGGDWLSLQMPDDLDPGIARFIERCAAGTDVSGSGRARKLLADFDELIELAWGKRTFRPFSMPPRAWLSA